MSDNICVKIRKQQLPLGSSAIKFVNDINFSPKRRDNKRISIGATIKEESLDDFVVCVDSSVVESGRIDKKIDLIEESYDASMEERVLLEIVKSLKERGGGRTGVEICVDITLEQKIALANAKRKLVAMQEMGGDYSKFPEHIMNINGVDVTIEIFSSWDDEFELFEVRGNKVCTDSPEILKFEDDELDELLGYSVDETIDFGNKMSVMKAFRDMIKNHGIKQ